MRWRWAGARGVWSLRRARRGRLSRAECHGAVPLTRRARFAPAPAPRPAGTVSGPPLSLQARCAAGAGRAVRRHWRRLQAARADRRRSNPQRPSHPRRVRVRGFRRPAHCRPLAETGGTSTACALFPDPISDGARRTRCSGAIRPAACSRASCRQQSQLPAAVPAACSSASCLQQSRLPAAEPAACSRAGCLQQSLQQSRLPAAVPAACHSCSSASCLQQSQRGEGWTRITGPWNHTMRRKQARAKD
jgi:hypothetical protein